LGCCRRGGEGRVEREDEEERWKASEEEETEVEISPPKYSKRTEL